MRQIDFLVEEPSMEAFLRGILPGLLGDVGFEVYPFQSKSDMLSNLAQRLRGYGAWLPPDQAIIVVIDADDDDCRDLKLRLEALAQQAGLLTRSSSSGGRFSVVNRLAIEELEAWYFGDWDAVRGAYPRVSRTIPQKRGFRDPDAIRGGTWEAFERVLQRAGYFRTGLRKIEAARSIASFINPERNTSRSFQVFRDAVLELRGA